MSDRLCIVLDANDGPCVRSLFKAVAVQGWRVVLMRVVTPLHLLHEKTLPFVLKESHHKIWRDTVVVPGFRKACSASESIVRWRTNRITAKLGRPDVVFYTMPRYCNLMKEEEWLKAYFAYDPYKLYPGWDYDQTESQEKVMLQNADLTFAVSRRICSDWQDQVKRETVYLPNGVDEGFMETLRSRSISKPQDLDGLDGPVVGCIGNINRSYDWVLIKKMSDALPHANFVFVGQITEVTPELEEIRKKKNIIFTGWRQPEELAGYLAAFDVCLNPLTVNDMNNRRCPLRFYSYLCTSKPVVSTAIDEAHELKDYLLAGNSHEECADLVKKAVSGNVEIDLEKRREFMLRQTWNQRAKALMNHVDKVVFSA